jgi:hypothetical protein
MVAINLFRKYLKRDEFKKALILKHSLILILMILSLLWLAFWGIDLFYTTGDIPEITVATFVVGYLGSFIKIYYDYKSMMRNIEMHRLIRSKRKV